MITRYYTILEQIDNITQAVEHFAKVADRAWGEERTRAISKQTDLYREQLAAQEKYVGEIEGYLTTDQNALTTMIEEFAEAFKSKTGVDIFSATTSGSTATAGAGGYTNPLSYVANHVYGTGGTGDLKGGVAAANTDPSQRTPINWTGPIYDENGVLVNYQEVVSAMIEAYNENAEAFAQDKQAQYKFQEMLKDIQFYTDTLNLYEAETEKLYDLRNAILDNQMREIVYKISIDNELDNNALKDINYQFEKIRDNAYRSAEAIDYYATKMDYLDKSNERYKEGLKDILAAYSGNVVNGTQKALSTIVYQKAPLQGYVAETPAVTGGGYSGYYSLSSEITDEDVYNLYPGLKSLADSVSRHPENPMNDIVADIVASRKKALSTDYSVNGRLQTLQNDLKTYQRANDYSNVRVTQSAISALQTEKGFLEHLRANANLNYDNYGNYYSGVLAKQIDQQLNGISFGHTTTTTTVAPTVPAADEPLTIDENGLVHLSDGSIVDTINRKRYKQGTATVVTGGSSEPSTIHLGDSDSPVIFSDKPWSPLAHWDGPDPLIATEGSSSYLTGTGTSEINTYTNVGVTTTTTSETTELPYFPTEPEIEKYFEDFEAIQIGNEVYYVPKSAEVEIRDDMVRPVDLTKVILNNKGQITADQKKLITEQVKGWYDELEKVSSDLVVGINLEYDEDGFITNFREVIEKINEINAKMSDDMYDLLLNDTEAFFAKWAEVTVNNSEFQDLTTETVAQIESMLDTIYANLSQKEKYIDAVIETIGNDVKTFSKLLNAQVDEFDYYNEVLEAYDNIINLTNRRSTNIGYDFINKLSDLMVDNAINKVTGTKTNYETMQKMFDAANQSYIQANEQLEAYRQGLIDIGKTEEEILNDEKYKYYEDRVDQFKEQMDIVDSKLKDSYKQFMKAYEDALNKIADDFKTTVENAAKTFEESFSPFFNTFELLQAQFEREKALEDYYVDNYERIHDLSALNREIEQSILDTDNLKSKNRLRDLQKEINDLQESGVKLSEYDLDVLEKKYQVELARQALEDAKDAKSLVRLARDNNGNWSYVYTSNDEEVAEAEQNYETAIRNMEEANENYIDNLEAQILQVQQSAEQAIANLNITDFANIEEYQKAVQNILNGAQETMRFINEQLTNAFGNNNWLDPYIIDRYGENVHDLTDDWKDLIMANLMGVNTLDDMVKLSKDSLNDLANASIDTFEKYSQKQAEVYAAAGVEIEKALEYFASNSNEIMEKSNESVEETAELADRIGNAFEKTAEKIKNFNKDIYDLTNQYEKLNQVMIHFLELSDAYVPDQKIDFATTIDTYKELDKIKQVLAEYGKVIVTDYDEKGNKRIYNLQENTEETAAQFDTWYDLIHKKEAIDVEEDLDTQDEYDKINAYLEKHGEVYISIDGELKKLVKDNEEDSAWLQEKLKAIEEAAAAAASAAASAAISITSSLTDSTSDYDWSDVWKDIGSKAQSNVGVYTHMVDGHIEAAWGGNFRGWNEEGKPMGTPTGTQRYDTGGYTGMYTGEWDGGSERKNGRLAWLHQKELVLNAHDTENFLDAMNIVRQLDNLASWMANGLGDLFMPRVEGNNETLEQNVHIEASFPNAVDHNEIEQAFGNLVNLASQYANRKVFA